MSTYPRRWGGNTPSVFPAGRTNLRSGFTLIELLVSMTVLALMVLAMSTLMTESSDAVDRGYGQAATDANARALLDTIKNDLEQMVVNSNLFLFYEEDAASGYSGFQSDRVNFFIRGGPDHSGNCTDETLKLVEYKVASADKDTGFGLRRGSKCFQGPTDRDVPSFQLIDNLVQFKVKFMAFDPASDSWVDASQLYGPGSGPILRAPMLADVFVMLLSDKDKKRVEQVSDKTEFIQEHAKRYYTKFAVPSHLRRAPQFGYY